MSVHDGKFLGLVPVLQELARVIDEKQQHAEIDNEDNAPEILYVCWLERERVLGTVGLRTD